MVPASAPRRRHCPATTTPRPAAARNASSAHRRGARGGSDKSEGRTPRTASAACWQLPAAASITETGGGGGVCGVGMLARLFRATGRECQRCVLRRCFDGRGGSSAAAEQTVPTSLTTPSHSLREKRSKDVRQLAVASWVLDYFFALQRGRMLGLPGAGVYTPLQLPGNLHLFSGHGARERRGCTGSAVCVKGTSGLCRSPPWLTGSRSQQHPQCHYQCSLLASAQLLTAPLQF